MPVLWTGQKASPNITRGPKVRQTKVHHRKEHASSSA